jgi:multidrug resistance efflux pump
MKETCGSETAGRGRAIFWWLDPADYVQVGRTLFSIVPDRFWVVANFKEAQLRYMRPGQPATVHVDAYPDESSWVP